MAKISFYPHFQSRFLILLFVQISHFTLYLTKFNSQSVPLTLLCTLLLWLITLRFRLGLWIGEEEEEGEGESAHESKREERVGIDFG